MAAIGVRGDLVNMPQVRASVLLLTYNQVAFVAEALSSLLQQDMGDLEIVISDDCSGDGTWQRIQAMAAAYRGPKRLVLRRNESNCGIVGNLLAAARCASADLLLIAHGDDVSLPNRCSRCLEFRRAGGDRYDLIAADAFDISAEGVVLGVKKFDDLRDWTVERWSQDRPYVLGAAQMITRKLLELTPLDRRLACEDQVLGFRAVMSASGIRLPEPLIRHRRGGLSQSRARGRREKRRALLRSASAAILEFEQLRKDALAGGCLERVRRGFDAQERLETYIVDMLDGRLGFFSRLRRCVTAGLPWSKRLRFLTWSFMGRQLEAVRG